MIWNWQQSDWPIWRFDTEALAEYEEQFMLGAGRLMGLWQHMDLAEKDKITIDLLSDEALKTSEIEGEYLDRDSVRSSLRRQFGLKTTHDAKPAESGIAELMVSVFQGFADPLSHETLFQWHALICRGREDLTSIGAYRTHSEAMQVVSGALHRPKIHFEAPASKVVPDEMEEFIGWMHRAKLPALTKAGLIHLYFVSIHPFEDGNGRIARALSEYTLANAFGQPSLIALSRQIEKDRKQYYDKLEANNKSMDIMPWLIWFAQTALKAQAYSQAMIDHIIAKTRMLDRLGDDINARQKQALIRMFDAGPEGFLGGLSAKNYMSITKAPTSSATRELADLVKKSALTRTGERKSTRYWLNI